METTKQDTSEVCTICLEPVSDRAVLVPCNHLSFDVLCILSWIEQRATCPLCKSTITAVDYAWNGPNEYTRYKVPPPSSRTSTTSNTSPTQSPQQPRNLSSLQRLNFNRRLPRRDRPPRHPRAPIEPDAALQRRRYVYTHNLYSLHVGANRLSAHANLTPALIASSPTLQSRARAFIRRELRVFSHLYPTPRSPSANAHNSTGASARGPDAGGSRTESGGTVGSGAETPPTSPTIEFLIPYVLSILRTVDVKGASGAAEDMLSDFLGRGAARLFWHELAAWLRSPYAALEDWDRAVQYRWPLRPGPGGDGAVGASSSASSSAVGGIRGGERARSLVRKREPAADE